MSDVTRYTYHEGSEDIFESDEGEWVCYSDYDDLKADYEDLQKKYDVLTDYVSDFIVTYAYLFKKKGK